jgi:hypothetical protein
MEHPHARPRPTTSSSLSVVRLVIPLVLAVALSPSVLSAQARPSAFETVDLSLTLLADVNKGTLHRYWSSGPAFAAGAALPFYFGIVEAGLQYAHPEALHGDVPGFRSIFVYAGWSGAHHLGSQLSVGGGLRLGVMAMRFDGDSLADFRRNESELGVAARTTLRWTPRGPWFTEASVTYQSILTHHRMEQVFLAAGLGRRFVTPSWLRDFLD